MAADRAINFALRVVGIGEVERDFKRVGAAGEKSFAEVEKSANGAAKEVSEYTARLKRAAAEANRIVLRTPDLNKGSADDIRQNQRDFKLGFINAEKERILEGVPDVTSSLGAAEGAAEGFGASLAEITSISAGVGAALAGLAQFALASLDAFEEHEKALDGFAASLRLGGNLSTATADEIAAMAARIVAATGQTEKAALTAAVTLAKVPGITQEGLEAALDASARLADALGTDVTETAEQASAVLSALADRDLKALYEATKGLSGELRLAIFNLADAGKTADAQRVYIAGLAAAAGDGPGGLTAATDRAADSWERLKISFGQEIAGPAAAGLNSLADLLDKIQIKANIAQFAIKTLLSNPFTAGLGGALAGAVGSGALGGRGPAFQPLTQGPTQAGFARSRALIDARSERAAADEVERRFGEQPKPRKSRAARKSGGGGKSDAQREAEKLAREAEQAEAAAKRVRDSNEKVAESYRERTAEVIQRTGIEGAALEALERHLAGEAAVRKLSTETIAKEVAARRAAAAVAKTSFDEKAVTAEVTAGFEAQADALRAVGEAGYDADQALKAFNQRQAEAKSLLEGLKTPLETINDEVERAIELLRQGAISPEGFDGRMKQLAGEIADVSRELDKGAQAWEGFGQDVGQTLSGLVLDGGSAKDVLKQLIRLPLERLLTQNVTNPIADLIDGLTGNNQAKNEAKARAGLPSAGTILGATIGVDLGSSSTAAAAQVTSLGVAAGGAAAALGGQVLTLSEPIAGLAQDTDGAAKALGGLIPLTGQLGGALQQIIAAISGGGGGGGGIFGSIVGAVIDGFDSARSGGSGSSGGGGSSGSSGAGRGFAGGTDRVPEGLDFWVGENGRERMRMHSGGRLEVLSNAQAHRAAGGGPSEIRVTISGARGNAEIQQMVMQGVRQGIAGYDRVVGDRVKDNLARRT